MPTPTTPSPDPIVALNHVTKTFAGREAVAGLSLGAGAGQLFRLIGPSGCGKTTTVRLLLGVLQPTSGTVRVLGADPRQFTAAQRERIGYTP